MLYLCMDAVLYHRYLISMVVHLGINIIIEELKHKIERLKGTESEIKCPNTRNHYIS